MDCFRTIDDFYSSILIKKEKPEDIKKNYKEIEKQEKINKLFEEINKNNNNLIN